MKGVWHQSQNLSMCFGTRSTQSNEDTTKDNSFTDHYTPALKPKCRSCRDAESELAKVVNLLSSKQVEVHVAKADVSKTKDRTKTSLGDRYQLQKLPTLMFFVADGIVKYQGRVSIPLRKRPLHCNFTAHKSHNVLYQHIK